MTNRSSPLNIELASVFVNSTVAPPEWLWDGQIARGCMTLLVGPPKAGKSLFVRNLIRCIAKGESFIGKETKTSAVIYLALEEHPSFLRSALQNADMANDNIHVHHGPVLGGEPEESLAYLAAYCNRHDVKLVVIDPMAKFIKIHDTNDYSLVYRKLSIIGDFARVNNVHVLLIHHSNKGGGDSAKQILGSTGIFGVSDGAFLLSRNGDSGSIRSDLRYGDSLDECKFSYDNGILTYGGTKLEVVESLLKQLIIQHLRSTGPSNLEGILAICKAQKQHVIAILQVLTSQNIVTKSGRGVKGSEHLYSIPVLDSLKREQEIDASSLPPSTSDEVTP